MKPFMRTLLRIHSARRSAFTRTELLIILATLLLLALVVLPALANNRPRSQRVICANNLRQIGVAQQLWGNDHNDLLPVMVPVNQGGTRAHALAANTWLHFAWLSNELATPKIVFCPSDSGNPAQDFTGSPTGGYLHPNFANRATSYFTSYSGFLGDPQWTIINGDRNVTIQGSSSCSLLNAASRIDFGSSAVQWTTNLHTLSGNVQLRDGRVMMTSSAELRALLVPPDDNVSAKHIALPR